ncbi:MAG: hypothetical protein Q7U40_02855 [Desulfatirhabdiaceae bacterium]|jgi:6-phosphogluconolactonase/glucosamine-6-phosphate isomerase/deaminase|nr:hypothetical protein [Desulfatirhabdiaceae bacterium]
MDFITPALISNPVRDTVNWSTRHVFWGDEQIHAADDSLSPAETAKGAHARRMGCC